MVPARERLRARRLRRGGPRGPAHLADRAARGAWLAEALSRLSDREKLIIHVRRLVEDGVTLESLGQKLGVSKERVRQIEHQALQKLRNSLTRMVGDPEEAGLIPSV